MRQLLNFGIKPGFEPWQRFFVRKLNLITLIGGFNVICSFLLFPFFEVYEFQTIMLFMALLVPFVFLANKYVNYIFAAYLFYIPGAGLMYFLTVGMGIESYIILFFFPLVFSIVHVLGRKETFNHMIILLSIYLVCIFFIAMAYLNGSPSITLPDSDFKTLRIYIMVLAMTSSFAFFAIVTFENMRQESFIKKMLREKEVLLAEVYHRVKNNMNIVTSLLNLKKNVSDSDEVKEALESCRSRVYSMSLVHEKFLYQNSFTKIDFRQYAKDLTDAVTDSFAGIKEVEVVFSSDELLLEVTQSIPTGLILNELLTNSFKHARTNGESLLINVTIKNDATTATLTVSDNGVGFVPEKTLSEGSMGLELVHSLCDQLDAVCNYESDKGSCFSIRFPIKKL